MSDEIGSGFLTPPTFQPAEAMVALKRQLRELRPLSERGNRFEINGKAVVELTAAPAELQARIARRLATTPDWDTAALRSSADVRKLVDDIRKRLARWQDEDR